MYSIEIEAHTSATPELVNELIQLSQQVTELDSGLTLADFNARMLDTQALILLARVEGELAGFKLGYALGSDTFYSWLGGVQADFRRLGLAKEMLLYQEKWAKAQGFSQIHVKTRNCYPAMINMLISNQYQIADLVADSQNLSKNKLYLQKRV